MARSWVTRVVEAPDGARRLAILCEEASLIYLRIAPLVAAVLAAADPDVSVAWQRTVQGRRSGMQRIMGLMASKGELREGVSPELAADILSGLHRHELYLAFTREAGWSFDRWRAWTYVALCRQLLPREVADAAVTPGSPALEGMAFAAALPEVAP
jgi:hypothetical protein